MKFFETSKYHSFKKSTYITLRWIGIIGQLIAVNFVYFFLNQNFDFVTSNIIILLGIFSNLYLIFIYKKTQLSDRSAFLFLLIDILQLGVLLYLSGGITNPFVIFILIPSVFSSSNLSLRTNTLLVILTIIIIIFLTFNYQDLPINLNSDFHNNHYFYYSIPTSLIIALVFLNYFAMTFGTQSRLRKEALAKMEEVMAKEHELLSLGGQAAAAAHSLGTPLSTITIIAHDLMKQFKGQKELEKDIELLSSQVDRCNEILKRLKISKKQRTRIVNVIKNHMIPFQSKNMRAAKLRRMMGDSSFPLLLELHRLDCMCSSAASGSYTYLQEVYNSYKEEPILPEPWINGSDLLAMGMMDGPELGRILALAYDRQLARKEPDRDALLNWLKKHQK